MEIRLVNDVNNPTQRGGGQAPYVPRDEEETSSSSSIDVALLVRRYWILLVALAMIGAGLGFASVVYHMPMYQATLLLEVQSVNEALVRNTLDGMSLEANDVNIQTQITILKGGLFRKRGADRMRSEAPPLTPMGRDIFSRLRNRFRPATRDPLENARRGLDLAVGTFDARPVNRTRLIELTCESNSPDVASQFLNSMAAEFVEDASQAHMQSSQKTSQWISGQIEETKSKLQEAEDRLRGFAQASGNLFAGQDTATLADVELAQAKNKLADVRSQRIAAQARYEFSTSHPAESLAEVQSDVVVRGYQQQINTLLQQRAALLVTFTPKHEKVQQLDAQIEPLRKAMQQQIEADVRKIRDDYEGAVKEERQRTDYWASKSQRVGAEAGKASRYADLKREVETLRQTYQSLQTQLDQAGLSNSVPMNPIRIVEPSIPAGAPYTPRPMLNISFGTMLGMALAGALVFLRERTDRSVRNPGSMRGFLNTPELGVIPNLYLEGHAPPAHAAGTAPNGGALTVLGSTDGPTALTNWRDGPAFIAESFRGTLASILRAQPDGSAHTALLITSPGPGEGKTTVVQHLGIALAETGRRVLLVDADFRRPHLHKRFRLPNERGLIDLLGENTPLADFDAKSQGLSTGVPGLFLLPNHPTDNHVARALYSPRLRAIFQKLRESYDMILVDAPPFLHLADARIIAPLADGAILVLRSGVTSKASATEAYRRMREDGLHLLGTILTAWDASNSYLRRHYYYYDYADDGRKQ